MSGVACQFTFCSKWFLQKIGHEGLNNLLMAYEDKTSYAMCVFSLALGPNTEPMTFVGKTLEEKNKISHRGKALELVKSHSAEARYTFQTDTTA
ncbi:hypothetical protein RND71_040094 [Anisodus tanguticus]|uniref:Uncharacterized protein n=1 Tax=Anisodus tanguticus TaxID=243964 RepID=A0AAE1QY09_9SOLA|nr:hypothetical protein RND71_040094 [Anisodus tanguticus]